MTQRRILIVTHDLVGENMAGPAIRCWEFARVLSRESAVTLATPFPTSVVPEEFQVVEYDAESLASLAANSETIIVSGYTLWKFPFLAQSEAALVVDIYDPFLLETLPLLAGEPGEERNRRHGDILDALTDLLVWGDFFLCASERQRDYWLGWLNAVDRINPTTYDDDPTLRRLIDVVAFGLPSEAPQHTRRVLKGTRPGIHETDHVVLWAGGVYNWFDPLTLIRAVARVATERSDVKLVFLGIGHPNPEVDHLEMAAKAVGLSQELGLYEKSVFFCDWTPYEERVNYLLEADVGASLHFSHLETRFAFRTRLLDHIWTALPTIVTRGDVLSALVDEEQLGWVVDYEDVDAVTAAILQSCEGDRDSFRARFEAVAPQFSWARAMEPLLKFCRNPHPAADRERMLSNAATLPALRLVSQLGALRRDLNARDNRVAFLENLVRDREATIGDLERRVLIKQAEAQARAAETASWRNEAERREVVIANLQTRVDAERAEIARLQTQIDIERAEVARLQTQFDAERAEVARLQTQIDATRVELDYMRGEAARLQGHIRDIEAGRLMRFLNGIQRIVGRGGSRG